MRFEPATFFIYQETGKDQLGNPIYENTPITGYKAKITQWTSEEIALLDRIVTQSQRKLLTNAPRNVLNDARSVLIDGLTYTITEVKSNFVRWRLLYVKEYKV